MNSIERFWDSAEHIPFSGCWIWMRGLNSMGYGRYTLNGERTVAHRLAYKLTTGKNIDGKCVCHKCDVPACINPEHLFIGTQADNLADMRKKNRHVNPPLRRGEDHHEGKLVETEILIIRKRRLTGEKLVDIASDYHVTPALISHIATRRKWKHV